MRKLLFVLIFILTLAVVSLFSPEAADSLKVINSMPDTSSGTFVRMPDLPNLGPAPELMNEVWINSEAPLRLAELRGKVVLLDMWTFG